MFSSPSSFSYLSSPKCFILMCVFDAGYLMIIYMQVNVRMASKNA